jgi:hypothetical protein
MIDWEVFINSWNSLPPIQRKVGELLGIAKDVEKVLYGWKPPQLTHAPISSLNDVQLRIFRISRFIHAIYLQNLVSGIPLPRVSEIHNVSVETLQKLLGTAISHANMNVSFCEKLNWNYMKGIMTVTASRIKFLGVEKTLIPLVSALGIKARYAKILHDNDLKNVAAVSQCNPMELERIIRLGFPFIAGVDEKKMPDFKLFSQKLHECASNLMKTKSNVERKEIKGVMVDGSDVTSDSENEDEKAANDLESIKNYI